MAKLKPPWVLTDIPKEDKVELWRLMKDNPTYNSWCGQAGLMGSWRSRDTWRRLKKEIELMPADEVQTLPQDLQSWIIELPAWKGKVGIVQQDKIPEDLKPEYRKKHCADITLLMERWKDGLKRLEMPGGNPTNIFYSPVEREKLFPSMLQHDPSVSDKYKILDTLRMECWNELLPIYQVLVDPLLEVIGDDVGFIEEEGKVEHGDEQDDIIDAFLNSYDPCEAIVIPYQNDHYTEKVVNKCQYHYGQIIKSNPNLLTFREEALRAFEKARSAKHMLWDEIDTSLIKGEYLKYRCEWCQ